MLEVRAGVTGNGIYLPLLRNLEMLRRLDFILLQGLEWGTNMIRFLFHEDYLGFNVEDRGNTGRRGLRGGGCLDKEPR